MTTSTPTRARIPVHVMAKPVGPICNLDCSYCYYLDKESLFPTGERFRMSEETLDRYVRQLIAAQPGPEVPFTWQGGEPTLLGLSFFRRAVDLQRRHLPPGWRATNAIQTNATLITDEWARFLAEEGFLVGVSVDGPPDIHDAHRVTKRGEPTSEAVLAGLERLLAAGVDVNILCVVNRLNSTRPREVYDYLLGLGVRHLQLIPLVEPAPPSGPAYEEALAGVGVSPRSVLPDDFGSFLLRIFEVWLRRDVGSVFVQTFEETLTMGAGLPPSLCVFTEECGRGLALEHNGDVFSCDHFVEPAHRLGNIAEIPLAELADGPKQEGFGRSKRTTLPAYCRACDVRRYCNGECPKNRIVRTPDGEPGLNYLCAGYRSYFRTVGPWMEWIAGRLRRGDGPRRIRELVAAHDGAVFGRGERNGRCPCGSGEKLKRCCLPRWLAGEVPGLPAPPEAA